MTEELAGQVASIRRFNRFYTRAIGVLGEDYLDAGLPLAAGRVLYELAQHDCLTPGLLGRDLGIDAGYLSRILKLLERRGWIAREAGKTDRRVSELRLTTQGHEAFARLDARSRAEIGALLSPLPAQDRARLVTALDLSRDILERPASDPAVRLRPHQAGDIGWIVERHGAIYARDYGWGARFESLVAEIGASFLKTFDAAREACWIAERRGERVGSVMVVRHDEDTAKLRLLLVTPEARGLGLGRALVEEVVGFARGAGYRRLTLWTQSNLFAARRIYAAAGFRLTHSEPYDGIGLALVSETWDLAL